MLGPNQYFTLQQASQWATQYMGKNVTSSNISYLVQYGKVKRYENDGVTQIDKDELKAYYDALGGSRQKQWKEILGEDLNWDLSFEQYKEAETTKHVHRLHPYKGKFIPQLVEYFLDTHTDHFKKEVFFKAGDIVLDPFSGSGTTMVQASEYDLIDVYQQCQRITDVLRAFLAEKQILAFDAELTEALNNFNKEYFPVPDYKYRLQRKEIDGKVYGAEKEQQFLPIYQALVEKYHIQLKQAKADTFLDKWYIQHVREEIDFVFEKIKAIQNPATKCIITLILSRTIRSCRATTHADLATLIEPITTTYYCAKHGKVCKPLFSILKWWETYVKDTIKRLQQFKELRTDTYQKCLQGDSRTIDIFEALEHKNPEFAALARKQQIKGIFSSPPYVGLIDYHEQHAYAYDLFGFERNDDKEIGPLYKGQGQEAKRMYVAGIAEVLINSKRFLADDYDVFLVANDKYGLYPEIAERAGMRIVNQYKRPVLNRTEKDKNAYAEIIFHLKEKDKNIEI
mgnify:CR=1 FL=1